MNIEYTLTIECVCPVDDQKDVYTCTVRSGRTIPVERILAEVKKVAESMQYQEDVTQQLSRALVAEVETVGYHSGVKTRVVCGTE